jgi:ADP-ribose pyrophosphatase YjhB (NUDIX family)
MTPPAFTYCPVCATPLEPVDDHGFVRPTCPRCGFIHYRNPAPATGAIVARGAAILLVRRRWAPRAGLWCLPAGFMEYGETPEQCAVRELREETGIVGRVTGLIGVYAGRDDPRVRAVLVVYAVRRTGGSLVPGDDAIDARFFAPSDTPERLAFHAHEEAIADWRATRARAARARRR